MTPKNILTIGLYLVSISCFAQFKGPEPTITKPEIAIPEYQINFEKGIDRPLKKIIEDKTTTEFDEKGNIIKLTEKDVTSTKTTTYVYKNNVLIEKNTASLSDSKRVQSLNAEEIRNSQINNESTAIFMTDVNSTSIYKATLDHKNKVISYSYENATLDNETTKATNKKMLYNIVYDKDNVVEINSDNSYKAKYYYENKLLTKKETIQGNDNETEDYSYDNNKNLTVKRTNKWSSYKGKIFNQYATVIDSTVYNNNNKIIWNGYKQRFTTYKYDDNNDVIERLQYANGKESIKEEYFYDNRLITKMVMTLYNSRLNGTEVMTTNYSYANGKLKEYTQTTSYNTSEKNCVYEYDESNRIIKITEYSKYVNKSGQRQTRVSNEQKFIYTPNSITLQGMYSSIKKYEFY